MDDSWGSFVVVAVIALSAPLLLAMAPRLLIPAIVLEVIAGIVVGPQVLGLASDAVQVEVFAQVGLAALLFLAGREIDVRALGGALIARAALGFAISTLVAVGIGFALGALDVVESTLLIGIVLASTSVGVIVVPLRDAGESDTDFGRQVLAGAAVAEFGTLVYLGAFSSAERGGIETELVHLAAFGAALGLVTLTMLRAGTSERIRAAVQRLEGTSAQITVRADMALLASVVGLAAWLGIEVVLAAFALGLIRGMLDVDDSAREKTEAVTFGVFVPFFFVSTGLGFDLDSLLDDGSAAFGLAALLLALLLARGISTAPLRRRLSVRQLGAAGLLEATTLSFIIVAAEIGTEIGVIGSDTEALLIGAGLISVLAFPAAALVLIRDKPARIADDTPPPV